MGLSLKKFEKALRAPVNAVLKTVPGGSALIGAANAAKAIAGGKAPAAPAPPPPPPAVVASRAAAGPFASVPSWVPYALAGVVVLMFGAVLLRRRS